MHLERGSPQLVWYDHGLGVATTLSCLLLLLLLLLPSYVYIPSLKRVVITRDVRFLDEGETLVPRPDDPSDPGPACAVCASKDEVYPSRVLLCDCTGCQNCAVAADNSTACFRAYHMEA